MLKEIIYIKYIYRMNSNEISIKNKKPSTSTTPQTSVVTKPSTSTSVSTESKLPDNATLQHAVRLSISEDKAIMTDYWLPSLEGKCLIGIKDRGEKLLVKSAEEYTSNISKLYKSKDEYIIQTENSIYIVSNKIPNKKIG